MLAVLSNGKSQVELATPPGGNPAPVPSETGSRRRVNGPSSRRLSGLRGLLFRLRLVAKSAVPLVVGVAGGYLLHSAVGSTPPEVVDAARFVHPPHGQGLTNPLLDVELDRRLARTRASRPFRNRIRALADRLVGVGGNRTISIYYRDLNDGASFGVNEKKKFAPASLMKVPTTIAWLKKAAQDPTLLDTKLQFLEQDKVPIVQNLRPREEIVVGEWYTVRDLLRRTLVFSDNNAHGVLSNRMPQDVYDQVLRDLSVDFDLSRPEDQVTVESYSTFFRVLYNATYLGQPMSELALELLLSPDFPQGIAAALPKGVRVASKFGERRVVHEAGETLQLHEFGIVYHPTHPFLIGVMTRGSDFDALAAVIRQIAGAVYAEVDGQPDAG
jgi:hypothetical protein